MTRHADYNANIQILRAVSVSLVVLFHLQVSGFAWGYLGVDLFFLISGFLMPVILPKYEAGTFMWARISRIYPALIACLLVCFLAGYLILIPLEFHGLSWSAITGVFSFSNIYFYFNAGYFDQDTQTQPLLHTWSLGNEFECYVIVGLMLLVTRDMRKLAQMALGVAALAAVIAIGFLVADGGTSNYFNPFGRIFLFFLAFFASAMRIRMGFNLGRAPAAALIVAAIGVIAVFFGRDIWNSQYPDASLFLIPLVGLPVMALAAPLPLPAPLRALAVRLGDFSYSIYIWHWPVITFEKVYLRNYRLNWKEQLLIAAVSIVIAVGSYYLIERRRAFRQPKVLVPATLLALAIGVSGIMTDGFSGRVPPRLAVYSMLENMQDQGSTACRIYLGGLDFNTRCGRQGPFTSTLIFAGDSHSRHFQTIIESREPHTRILQFASTMDVLPRQLAALHKAAREIGADRVYITFHYDSYGPDAGKALVAAVQPINQDRLMMFVRDIPDMTFDNVACFLRNHSALKFKSCGFKVSQGVPYNKVGNLNEPIWNAIAASGQPLLDTHPALCHGGKCYQVFDGELIMRDRNHLNERLSRKVQQQLYGDWFASDRQAARMADGAKGGAVR